MKGISTILAMILIVIIVVALIGMTYTFAVGLFSTTTTATENQTSQITGNMGKTVNIVAARCDATANSYTYSLRNTGTQTIRIADLALFADGSLVTVNGFDSDLTVGEVDEFTATVTDVTAGSHTLRVSTPAGEIEERMTC